jgi:hypothetical protein
LTRSSAGHTDAVRLGMLVLGSLVSFVASPSRAEALPAGRTWAPIDSLGDRFTATRIGADSSGVPMLVAVDLGDSLAKRGWSTWQWSSDRFIPAAHLQTAGAMTAPEPVVGTRAANDLLWLSHVRDAQGAGRVLWARVQGVRVSRPDTVMSGWLQSSESAGARGVHRTWVVRCEQRFPKNETFGLRVRMRDSRDKKPVWRELPELGTNEFTCTIAPLPNDEAMLVYAGESGLAWVRTRGLAWADSGRLDVRRWTAAHPRFRVEQDRTLTLLWTTREWVHLARWRDGRWMLGDSLRVEHADGETFWAGWCDVSREPDHAPALAWGDRGYGMTQRDVLCVAVMDSSGRAAGTEVPGTEGAFIPTVARDRNGDVWLAWSHLDRPGVFVTHTYVTVTCDTPRVIRRAGQDRVEWTLSAPAPGSWWIVERAEASGPFAQVGRIRAGASREVSWSARAGAASARYRIRRDSLDERTSWVSSETTAP